MRCFSLGRCLSEKRKNKNTEGIAREKRFKRRGIKRQKKEQKKKNKRRPKHRRRS